MVSIRIFSLARGKIGPHYDGVSVEFENPDGLLLSCLQLCLRKVEHSFNCITKHPG